MGYTWSLVRYLSSVTPKPNDMAPPSCNSSFPVIIACEAFEASQTRLTSALGNALPKETQNWLLGVKIPDFSQLSSIDAKANELDRLMESFLSARRKRRQNPERLDTVKNVARSWFRGTYPFTRVFLSIAQAGSAVFDFKLSSDDLDTSSQSIWTCMLWSLSVDRGISCDCIGDLKIAYKQTASGEKVDETMQFLVGTFQTMELTNDFPPELDEQLRERVQASALNLCAATCDYLGYAITNIRRSFGSKCPRRGCCSHL